MKKRRKKLQTLVVRHFDDSNLLPDLNPQQHGVVMGLLNKLVKHGKQEVFFDGQTGERTIIFTARARDMGEDRPSKVRLFLRLPRGVGLKRGFAKGQVVKCEEIFDDETQS